MAQIETPTTAELWKLLQEERVRTQRLEEQIAQLQEERAGSRAVRPEAAPKRSKEQRLSRAKLLSAAGLAGVTLAGAKAGTALAQTPPPIPSFTAFPDPRRVMSLTMAYNQTSSAIDATITTSGTASGVPAGAQSAWAAVMAYQGGVLTIFPDGAADPGIGNWAGPATTGALNMLYMLVPLSSAGKFKVHAYFAGTIYVDVWGYLY